MMEEPRDSQQKSERIDATPVASRGGSWQRRSERQCDDASPSGSAEAPEEGGASREKSSGYKRRQGDDEAKNKRRKVDADTTVTAVVMNARGVASIPLY
ncbi:expressed unknown protein [Seminavis robusta]|uniref:Uncharacterized protein n=1 Tax=Seminavis robusta TaxID=568900 RepID=A0A9N8HQJ9_9STRA|nr:expressed unknown protein [Seminavis robusta]|eukprot:Sro1200_g251940.1 n/a (99) ;mRNA; f:33015-33311